MSCLRSIVSDSFCNILNKYQNMNPESVKKVIDKEFTRKGEVTSDEFFFKSLQLASIKENAPPNKGKPKVRRSSNKLKEMNSNLDMTIDDSFCDDSKKNEMHSKISNISNYFSSNQHKRVYKTKRKEDKIINTAEQRKQFYLEKIKSKTKTRQSMRIFNKEIIGLNGQVTVVPADKFSKFCSDNFPNDTSEHAIREQRKAEIIKNDKEKLKRKVVTKNTRKSTRIIKEKLTDNLKPQKLVNSESPMMKDKKETREKKIKAVKIKKAKKPISYAKQIKIKKAIEEKVFMKVKKPAPYSSKKKRPSKPLASTPLRKASAKCPFVNLDTADLPTPIAEATTTTGSRVMSPPIISISRTPLIPGQYDTPPAAHDSNDSFFSRIRDQQLCMSNCSTATDTSVATISPNIPSCMDQYLHVEPMQRSNATRFKSKIYKIMNNNRNIIHTQETNQFDCKRNLNNDYKLGELEEKENEITLTGNSDSESDSDSN